MADNKANVSCNENGKVNGHVEIGPKTFRTQGEVNRNEDGKAVHVIDLTGVPLEKIAIMAGKQLATDHTNTFRQYSRDDSDQGYDDSLDDEAIAYRGQFNQNGDVFMVEYHWSQAGVIDAPVTKEKANEQFAMMLGAMDPGARESFADEHGLDLSKYGY